MALKIKGFAALALMLGVATAAHAAPPPASPGTAIAIMQASAALQGNDCKAAVAPLNQLWHDPYFEASDPKMAAEYRLRLIACTADVGGLREALALSTENIARDGSGLTAFDMQAFLQLVANQPAAAADTLDAAMDRFPAEAPNLSDMTMLGAVVTLHDSSPDRELALLDHMEKARWQVHTLSARPAMGLLRVEGLRHAVTAGTDDVAALYRTDLKAESIGYIVSQGDGLVSSADAAPDSVEPTMAAQIAEAKAQIVKVPNDLATLAYLMTLERADSQSGAALTQLNGIIDLIDKYGLQNFQNPEMYGELLADRALLLRDQGRYADAQAIFQDGANRLKGLPSGDFFVTYAAYLVARGQDQAAVDLIGKLNVGAFSDGQKAQLILTDACAFGHLNDHADFSAFLAAVGDPSARVKPRLCAGDADGAARDFAAAMAIPQIRADTILMMQTMHQGLPASDSDRRMTEAMTALKTRDDVAAAARAASILVRSWDVNY